MADQHREVGEAVGLGPVHRHRVGRCGGLEAVAEDDHLLVGVVPGDAEGIERGVDDPDVAARALDGEQVLGPGHAQQVAERAEDHVGLAGDLQGLVDDVQRRDAHRAAGAVDQFDLVG